MSKVTIKISKNGPLLVSEDVTLIDRTTGKEVKPPKVPFALCRCGLSSAKPFCDGAHNRGFDGTLVSGLSDD